MKKLLFCLLALGVTFSSQAQSARVGLRAGLTFSSLYYPRDYNPEPYRPGFTLAVPVEFPLTRHWALQPELAFTTRGWRSEHVVYVNPRGKYVSRRIYSGYTTSLEIPVTFKYYVNSLRQGAYLLAGPMAEVWMYGAYRDDDDDFVRYNYAWQGSDRVRLGLALGVGYLWRQTKLPLYAELRFQDTWLGPGRREYAHVRGVTLSGGLWLPGGKAARPVKRSTRRR